MNYQLKKYRIIYNFNHSKMGFNNCLTVIAFNVDEAIQKVKNEVAGVYGTKMLTRFSFKPDPLLNGVVI
jgi:hypothetical protein